MNFARNAKVREKPSLLRKCARVNVKHLKWKKQPAFTGVYIYLVIYTFSFEGEPVSRSVTIFIVYILSRGPPRASLRIILRNILGNAYPYYYPPSLLLSRQLRIIPLLRRQAATTIMRDVFLVPFSSFVEFCQAWIFVVQRQIARYKLGVL